MSTHQQTAPRFSPLDPASRSLAWKFGAVVVGSIILTLGSYIQVPMFPVPMTMQTFAVALVGALYGWRLGTITILAWLGQAAAGMPVLAGGAGGIAHFFGPTGGYLLSFPLMGALIGFLAERGWNGHRPLLAFLSMSAGHVLCLALGATWLAMAIGWNAAIVHGVTPFILGSVLKSALGAGALAGFARAGARRVG